MTVLFLKAGRHMELLGAGLDVVVFFGGRVCVLGFEVLKVFECLKCLHT